MDLSKKYRIVETIEGFKIQKRTLFFWCDFSVPRYSYDEFCSGMEYERNYVIIFDTKSDAQEYLKFILQFPIEYKGHLIIYAGNNLNDLYIDLSSSAYKSGYLYYRRYASSLEKIKDYIDQEESDKEFRKNKNKIIKTYEID